MPNPSPLREVSDSLSFVAAEDILGQFAAWQRAGTRAALVTLVANSGAAPRPIGAHMVVAEDGRYAGYLSGGCLEAAVAKEAQSAILARQNRLVRFGEGSQYLDLKLPCGSSLDLYVDQALDAELTARMQVLQTARTALWFSTDLGTGRSNVTPFGEGDTPDALAGGNMIRRAIVPPPRVLLVGGGPSLAAIGHLIASAGFEIAIVSPDGEARAQLSALGHLAQPLVDAAALDTSGLDRWSAAIVAFHEHDWEAPVLAQILRHRCFYIGVLGSRLAQGNRLERLAALGYDASELARVRGPIGLIPGTKSRVTLAVSVLAELASEVKAHGMLA